MKLTDYDMTGQAELVRTGEVAPTEPVQQAIEAIERIDPHLDAVIQKMYDRALSRAATLDVTQAAFPGVPIMLKDHAVECEGDLFSWGGFRFLRDMKWSSRRDTHTGAALRRAGVVPVARSNLSLMALFFATHDRDMHVMPRNPWNLGLSAGGSSSGSAAAVASRMVPIAHGNDSGGSIRLPASFCGVVGLKPTRARVSQGPYVTELMSILDAWNAEFVLTRSVRDSIAMLAVLEGWRPGDAFSSLQFDIVRQLQAGPDPLQLRIGVTTTPFAAGFDTDSECARALQETANLLEELGHRVEVVHPKRYDWADMQESDYGDRAVPTFARIARTLDQLSREIGRPVTQADVGPQVWTCAELGRSYSALQLLEATEHAQAIVTDWDTWWSKSDFDVLATPTVTRLPPPMTHYLPAPEGTFHLTDDNLLAGVELIPPLIAFTHIYNMTGQPAISLPLAVSDNGLPIGVQFGAAHGRDDLLLRLSLQLEEARPWSARRPQVCA